MVNEEHAFEMIHFMLQAGGQHAVGFDFHPLTIEIEADGMLATCLQHEMDHLEGVLFIDHLSKLKRAMLLKKLTKAKKLAV